MKLKRNEYFCRITQPIHHPHQQGKTRTGGKKTHPSIHGSFQLIWNKKNPAWKSNTLERNFSSESACNKIKISLPSEITMIIALLVRLTVNKRHHRSNVQRSEVSFKYSTAAPAHRSFRMDDDDGSMGIKLSGLFLTVPAVLISEGEQSSLIMVTDSNTATFESLRRKERKWKEGRPLLDLFVENKRTKSAFRQKFYQFSVKKKKNHKLDFFIAVTLSSHYITVHEQMVHF